MSMNRINTILRRIRPGTALARITLIALLAAISASGADSPAPADAQRHLLTGRWTEAAALARHALSERAQGEEWHLILIEALMTTGRYAEAHAVLTNAIAAETRSVRLRWAAREVLAMNGDPARAAAMVREITELVSAQPWAYRDARDLVVFGRAALLAGADPKRVLERIFDTLKRAVPPQRDAFRAAGELALDKHDYALAARTFREGLEKLTDDPDLHYGLARAYAPSQPALAQAAIEAALNTNTNHVPTLLLLADHSIDAEDHAAAEMWLARVEAVNPWHPEAWAYRAVLARLANEPAREDAARQAATRFWPANPRVPHLIGRKLSQDYRFAEGALLQREALASEPAFLPAKSQLAYDLLRLGEDEEGWRLAEEVHQKDGYDVAALNLVTLRDTMGKYATLTNAHFIVRMTPREAALYGARALDLLEDARARLTPKYGVALGRPVRVEIFSEQKDFAVRTFGMPENEGFLGVCFGLVITANSPASRPGQPFNWESMLWHEFAHVVTLGLTRNKMPRWLSEGISVYEERQANPAWGERMVPKYREMILGDDLTPVGQLSAAFLEPRSALHLQFAYYQCSLVVEFIVEKFGFDALTAILRDLGEGMAINPALTRHIAPLPALESQFATHARERARQWAPNLRWDKPLTETLLAQGGDAAWTAWAKLNPDNFYVLARQAATWVGEKRWSDAKPLLQTLVDAVPQADGLRDAYEMLAETHRQLGETDAERQVLTRLAERDDKALGAYQRLMELADADGDWPVVIQNARRYLAVNPLAPLPYRHLARAAEEAGQSDTAVGAYRALLELDPPNPAAVHFQLARQLHQAGDPAARRHLLCALEDAPRNRAALRFLLELEAAETGGKRDTIAEPPLGSPPNSDSK